MSSVFLAGVWQATIVGFHLRCYSPFSLCPRNKTFYHLVRFKQPSQFAALLINPPPSSTLRTDAVLGLLSNVRINSSIDGATATGLNTAQEFCICTRRLNRRRNADGVPQCSAKVVWHPPRDCANRPFFSATQSLRAFFARPCAAFASVAPPLFFCRVAIRTFVRYAHTLCAHIQDPPHQVTNQSIYGHTSPAPSVFLQQYRKICPNILPDRFVYITSNQLSNPGLLVGFPFMTPASLRLAGDAQGQARKLPPGLKICIVNN